ncbi:arylamine N-acetyltransferase [Shimia sp.]|uniref:arylamine N-acetyltransferase family protein n=1 Tax=Shimia sp. TaxID=1954381 RepID=UPI003299E740
MLQSDAYLARLGLAKPVPHTLKGLQTLQAAHLHAIPFENLDPLLGIVPDLDLGAIQTKMLKQGRGGYCFEQNALFGCALREWGFAAEPLLARVRNGAPHGGARSHQAWIVAIESKEYLADVGFGGAGSIAPLRISTETTQDTPSGAYRISHDDTTNETVLDKMSGTGWFSLFSFDRIEVAPVDFEAANHLCATWDKAPFRTNLMMARHLPSGRISLFNRAFREAGQTRMIDTLKEFETILTNRFGLTLPAGMATAAWQRIKDQPTGR